MRLTCGLIEIRYDMSKWVNEEEEWASDIYDYSVDELFHCAQVSSNVW